MESEFLVNSLSLWTLCFVKINNSPSLVLSTVVTPHLNCRTFLIFASFNIEDLVGLPVDELILLILENLPPSRVSAPDLHVIGSTRALDIPRLVIVSGSDGQGLLMEVPDLGSSTVWNLNDHVSIVNEIEISVVWHFRNNVEVSLNIESESLIELSFLWFTFPFINIDNVPLLVNFIVRTIDCNVSVFSINSSLDFQCLSFLVHDLGSFISEHLPPS
jgi:hypothetical protein